jgi:hypothetical protein
MFLNLVGLLVLKTGAAQSLYLQMIMQTRRKLAYFHTLFSITIYIPTFPVAGENMSRRSHPSGDWLKENFHRKLQNSSRVITSAANMCKCPVIVSSQLLCPNRTIS